MQFQPSLFDFEMRRITSKATSGRRQDCMIHWAKFRKRVEGLRRFQITNVINFIETFQLNTVYRNKQDG